MRPSFGKSDTWTLVAAAIVFSVLAVIILSVFNTSAFPIDDAFISFRYARNLVDGFGLVFNQGERVEAYSNFFWLLLVSGFGYLAGVSEILAARFLGLASLIALCLLLFLQVRRATGSIFLPFIIGLVFMLLPGTIFHALSGMETVLSAALLMAAANALESNIEPMKKALLAGFCLAAFSLNRPEGLLLLACVLIGTATMALLSEKNRAHAGWLLASYACVMVPFLVWRFFYYGTLVPNSVLAKSGFLHPLVLKTGAKYLGLFLYWHAPLVLLAGFSFFSQARARWFQFRVPVTAALTATALLGGVGDGYPYTRYLYPLLACLFVWSVEGGLSITRWAKQKRVRLAGFGLVVLLCGIQVVLLRNEELRSRLVANELNPLRRPMAFFRRTPQSADPAILRAKGLGHHQAGEWLRMHASPGDLLATYEIGTVPYFSRLPVLDLFGLADRRIARNRGLPGHKVDLPYVWSRKPAYFMLRVPSDCLCSNYPLFLDRRLKDDYDLVALFPYWTTDILILQGRAQPRELVIYDLAASVEHRTEGPIRLFGGIQLLAPGEWDRRIAEIRQLKDPDAMRNWMGTWRNVFALSASEREERGAVTFDFRLPEDASLAFGIGVTASQESAGAAADHRKARVQVVLKEDQQTETLFERDFDPAAVTAGWEDHQVDLARFAGRQVSLTLRIENDGLPLNVGFGDPRIVSSRVLVHAIR